MGLDQTMSSSSGDKEYDWRKHARLQQFMARKWREQNGGKESDDSGALGHLGFEKYLFRGKTPLTLGQRYFHYLHHKYFECNYGGDGTVPMDKWFGSFHDGTKEAHELMKQRRKRAHALT